MRPENNDVIASPVDRITSAHWEYLLRKIDKLADMDRMSAQIEAELEQLEAENAPAKPAPSKP